MADTFLEETKEMLKECGKSPQDVRWCGSYEFGWFSWEEFVKVANFEYDEGFGAQEVARDLIIVGDDFWLERREYDGSEWWEMASFPGKPKNKAVPKYLYKKDECESSLKELNHEKARPQLENQSKSSVCLEYVSQKKMKSSHAQKCTK